MPNPKETSQPSPEQVAEVKEQEQAEDKAFAQAQLAAEEAERTRRMPDYIRSFLLKVQGGKLYLPVMARLVWWRDDTPAALPYGVETEMIEGGFQADYVTFRAVVRDEAGNVLATAHKTETRQGFGDFIEKAETGAVGRALAMCGYGTQFDETLLDVRTEAQARPADSPVASQVTRQLKTEAPGGGVAPAKQAGKSGINPGPNPCPSCNAPAGKPHGSKCKSL